MARAITVAAFVAASVLASSAIAAPASVYPFTPARIIDGDTISGEINIWPGWTLDIHIRVAGIDAPETTRAKCDAERELGLEAKREAEKMLSSAKDVTIRNPENGAFAGRIVAEVWLHGDDESASLGDELLRRGLAREYGGDTKPVWCPE